MVSIYDIAKVAGVSAATVSRALSGSNLVSAESKRKIKKIAEELGYHPNLVARNLRQKSTSVIGLLLDDVSDELSGAIVKGVEDEMKKDDKYVLVWNAQHEYKSELAALELFKKLNLEGIILADTTLNIIENLPEIDKPAILINRMYKHNGIINYVGAHDFQGAYDATQYLIRLGHRNIAYINGPMDWQASIDRLEGYKSAMKEAKLPAPPDYVMHGDWYEKSAYQIAKRLLQMEQRPTAIFAASDMMAIGVMDAARELGISIPGELSVMGYDNRVIAEYSRPRLTTITLPFYEVGVAASRALKDLIKNRHEDLDYNLNIRIRGEIIERETTAKLKLNE